MQIVVICLVLLLMLISIIFGFKFKFKKFSLSVYWIVVLLGAIICISFGWIDITNLQAVFVSTSAINPLKILIIFISLASLSILLDEIGFFSYLAHKVLKKNKSSQTRLFFSFYIIISLLTIITSNDIIILTFTPFICYFAIRAEIDPTPFVVSEFVAANTWSNFLIIGNPTNIYLATSFNITFLDYLLKMALPTILTGVVSFTILYLLFRKKLKQPIVVDDEFNVQLDKPLLITGLMCLISCIVAMAISSYINLEMWYIPLAFSAIAMLVCLIISLIKKQKLDYLLGTIKKLPFNLIPFLLSMAVIIATIDSLGYVNIIANLIKNLNPIIIGLIAFVVANIINNIPMTMLFTAIFSSIIVSIDSIFSVIFASNICAFFTPLGALAGIMFMNILKENDVKFNYLSFVKYGVVIAIPSLITGLLAINLF